MDEKNKRIRLSGHARQQIRYRGATEADVIQTIRSSPWKQAEFERLECTRNFIFEREWNDKYYNTQQIRPIFVEEEDEITVVTVYVYYF